jgi:hypothetical protein
MGVWAWEAPEGGGAVFGGESGSAPLTSIGERVSTWR